MYKANSGSVTATLEAGKSSENLMAGLNNFSVSEAITYTSPLALLMFEFNLKASPSGAKLTLSALYAASNFILAL